MVVSVLRFFAESQNEEPGDAELLLLPHPASATSAAAVGTAAAAAIRRTIQIPPTRTDKGRGSLARGDVRGSTTAAVCAAIVAAMDDDAVVVHAAGHDVPITSPGKVFFSERGETKLDLVRFYQSVE